MSTMEPIDYEQLDPGIRNVVKWLRDHGFETVDSGDGKSKPGDAEGVQFFPHVVIRATQEDALSVFIQLRALGVEFMPVTEAHSDSVVKPCMEYTYDPADGLGFGVLMGVDDEMLGRILSKPPA